MVVRGRVKILKETEHPGHPVVLGVFGPGSLIFDSSLVPEHPRDTTAVAMEDVEFVYLICTLQPAPKQGEWHGKTWNFIHTFKSSRPSFILPHSFLSR